MSGTEDQACINLRWAVALMEGLVAGGMRHLVISPGSRSTPLVLAARRQPGLELKVILDERSAAFYALGAALASGRPAGLVCTSGSAPAHWLPAVIEAAESRVPLVLLSADRPPELRGWGANQTIDQTRLFGVYAKAFHDPGPAEQGPHALKRMLGLGLRAAAESQGMRPGPVHLNLPFREPLTPAEDCFWPPDVSSPGLEASPPAREAMPGQGAQVGNGASAIELPEGRGLICCGPGADAPGLRRALWACAERIGCPVLCDPLSGLRFGPGSRTRICRYDSFLRNPETAARLKPDWVLRLGRAPVSKTLGGWLAGVPTVLIDQGEGWSDPSQDVYLRLAMDPAAPFRALGAARASGTDWLGLWERAEVAMNRLAEEHLSQTPWCEGHLIADMLEVLPEGEGLLCANSMPIRQLDTWSGSRETGLEVFGNRGASGIDGQTSTLAGLQAGGTPTTGLVGDLSFLHDLSGLQLLRELRRPCIVLSNGGGRIFDYLPQYALPDFEAFWRTPVPVDLRGLVRSFGLVHRQVSDAEGFGQALLEALEAGRQGAGGRVIEVQLDGDLSRETHLRFWRAIQTGPSPI